MKKSTRTISGITPVAVMTEPGGCPGKCIYCPTFSATPQSYTPESPAVLRARSVDYDAYRQVESRLKTLAEMGHPVDKIELIIMGGTFLARPIQYQYDFVKSCFDALNEQESSCLAEAKHINETALHRCTGLCVETRPDFCTQADIDRMLDFGATRVELGVQTLSDEVYKLVQRGHGVEDVAKATALLRQNGLKVHYHWMPGLPGSNPDEDLRLSRLLFEDRRFRPDGLKIYPTMVIEGTELELWYQDGRYQPYGAEEMLDLIAHIKALVPPYVRISRVLRDIPAKFVVGGLRDSLRDPLKKRMQEMGLACRCIRCREYGFRLRDKYDIGTPELKRMDYEASGGREIFFSFEAPSWPPLSPLTSTRHCEARESPPKQSVDPGSGTNDQLKGESVLFGLLRLRIQDKPIPNLPDEIGLNAGLVRELHVFGPEMPLSQRGPQAAQHRGLGKSLLREAERIARDEFKRDWSVVLSGVGAREYYRAEAYDLVGSYMVKRLRAKS